ncbi:MAG: hypothetical protein LGB54_00670 [Sulfurovum sp.]|nr:hypothetical protein [Sulfurovum sp.]
MFKVRYIGQYILMLLLLILVVLEIWTYYLGTADVTFKRLIGSKPYPQIENLTLRRYEKNMISPHLFTVKTKDERAVINQFSRDCHLKRIASEKLPIEVKQTDLEMVEVIKKSPFIYLSEKFDLAEPKKGRMCLLFRDKTYLYLLVNGNL